MKNVNIKKLLILNIPYILLGLFATNLGEAWRLAEGADMSAKLLGFFDTFMVALSNPLPSFHPLDLVVGIIFGAGLRLAVYMNGKNAKKYRHNEEYGSARWGTAKDIEPFMDQKFEDNIILSKTERLMMSNRPKNPANARNKNVLIIGGSGSGKTRFWLKPNLLQMHSSYVVTDPKGSIVIECGNALLKHNYNIKIRIYNSMVLGIQNYYQLATCISIDCRKIHRQVMTVLTNRLNTETGCKLVREGGTMTQSEKERFGKSAMVRYVSGIDQPIYPIAYIKNKIPMAKKTAVCSYTADGRALIHTNLSLNSFVLTGLRSQPSGGRSTELTDSRISLFSAQRGKCALCGELFENAAEIVCWLKTPAEMGGKERYQNMILFHERFLPLLQDCPQNELKAIADTFKATKELMLKVNSLREQAGLSAIEI